MLFLLRFQKLSAGNLQNPTLHSKPYFELLRTYIISSRELWIQQI